MIKFLCQVQVTFTICKISVLCNNAPGRNK